MEKDSITLSVVTTAYNEDAVLVEFIRRTCASLEGAGCPWELIIVDDGSSDKTWEVVTRAAADNSKIRGVRLSRNFGHQRALVSGLQQARGELVCSIDADLQDPPELILGMLKHMQAHHLDLVYGQRSSREGVGWLLRLCYQCFYAFLGWVSGTPIPKDTGDFRIVKKRLLSLVLAMPDAHDFLRGAFAWVGFAQGPFYYNRKGRGAGKSSYTVGKLIDLAINGIWGFSLKPLRLAILLSFGLAMFAVMVALYIVATFWMGADTPWGWASLAVVVLLTGSANLLALGTIAEYIGQILKQTRRRTAAIVAEVVEY